jgi:hypothetical protein
MILALPLSILGLIAVGLNLLMTHRDHALR